MTKPVKQILTLEQQQRLESDARPWEWPRMPVAEDKSDSSTEARTNAVGMAADWYRHDRDKVESEPEPGPEPLPALTASDLDAIRQAAYDEGRQQGWQEGQQQGYQEGLEQGRQAGYEAGHQQGMSAGHEQGLAQGQAEIEALTGRWQQLLDALCAPQQQIDSQVEQQLVQLVLVLVREVVRVEAVTNSAVILNSLKRAIEALPAVTAAVRIRLHPEDLKVVQQAFSAEECHQRGWQLLAEPACERGDIQLDCGDSAVELYQHAQLAELVRNFLLENSGVLGKSDLPENHLLAQQHDLPAQQDHDD